MMNRSLRIGIALLMAALSVLATVESDGDTGSHPVADNWCC